MHYHRTERDDFIAYLAERFPKCFFQDPSQRRPLKRNIIDDLDRAGVLDSERLAQALDWYMSHFSYQYALIAGNPRIDLEGNKAGTVTLQEQQEARKRIAARKSELKEQQVAVTKPVVVLKAKERMNGANVVSKPVTPNRDDPVAEMQSAITIVSNILLDKQYAPLRSVLATAALKDIVGRAEKLIESLVPAES